MEAASLTQAHAAVRTATSHHLAADSSLAVAASHQRAADGFQAASDDIHDPEAVRILKLLEEQHRQLARLVSSEKDADTTTTDSSPPTAEPAAKDAASPSQPPKRATSPTLARRPPRDLSSSIASNLATARGIPQSKRLSSTVQAALPIRTSVIKEEHEDATPKPVAPTSSDLKSVAETSRFETTTTQKPNPDEPFERFYASFGGLISKLSAPLAFAGLPLTSEQQPPPPPPIKHSRAMSRVSTRSMTSSTPDITKIFSKAALTAVKQDNPGLGGVQESFLVVPSSGGTVPYANIHRKLDVVDDETVKSNETIDGSEVPQQRSPRMPRPMGLAKGAKTGKTTEELEMENESLKRLTDNLSRRLYMWEKSAQNQGQAFQQSIRILHPPSHPPSESGNESSNEQRISELEEQVKASKKEIERFARENEKLKTVVMRYRERWEKLKEGARSRREGAEKGEAG